MFSHNCHKHICKNRTDFVSNNAECVAKTSYIVCLNSEVTKVHSKSSLVKSSEKLQKSLKKIAILKICELVSFWGVKNSLRQTTRPWNDAFSGQKKYFILLTAFYMIMWLMKSPHNFEKIAILLSQILNCLFEHSNFSTFTFTCTDYISHITARTHRFSGLAPFL